MDMIFHIRDDVVGPGIRMCSGNLLLFALLPLTRIELWRQL